MLRKKQIQQLLAVCLFAYLPAIIYSIYLLITGAVIVEDSDKSGQFTFTIIHMVLAVTLLYKVLSQRGGTYLFSLFYIKTGKLTTVIVAHLVMDLAILAH